MSKRAFLLQACVFVVLVFAIGCSPPSDPEQKPKNDKPAEKVSPAKATQIENVNKSNWQTSKDESIMGDAKNVYISTQAKILHENRFGRSLRAALYIRCQRGTTDLLINFDTNIDADLYDATVEYKIDDGKIIKNIWSLSKDFEAIFARKPIALIKTLIKAKRLTVRVQSQFGGALETYFDLEGLAEAIKPVQECCGWK